MIYRNKEDKKEAKHEAKEERKALEKELKEAKKEVSLVHKQLAPPVIDDIHPCRRSMPRNCKIKPLEALVPSAINYY